MNTSEALTFITERLSYLEAENALLRVSLDAADDIVKAYESPGVNNEVWVAIQYYQTVRGLAR